MSLSDAFRKSSRSTCGRAWIDIAIPVCYCLEDEMTAIRVKIVIFLVDQRPCIDVCNEAAHCSSPPVSLLVHCRKTAFFDCVGICGVVRCSSCYVNGPPTKGRMQCRRRTPFNAEVGPLLQVSIVETNLLLYLTRRHLLQSLSLSARKWAP